MSSHRIDPSDIHGGNWEVYEVTPDYRRSRLQIDENTVIHRTEYLGDEELIEDNQRRYNESCNQRWGDGKIVARVPLNMMYSNQTEIAKYLKEGDQDHLKWWLDREEARPYRTFKGRIK